MEKCGENVGFPTIGRLREYNLNAYITTRMILRFYLRHGFRTSVSSLRRKCQLSSEVAPFLARGRGFTSELVALPPWTKRNWKLGYENRRFCDDYGRKARKHAPRKKASEVGINQHALCSNSRVGYESFIYCSWKCDQPHENFSSGMPLWKMLLCSFESL